MWEFTGLSEHALLRQIVRRETLCLLLLIGVGVAGSFATYALARRAETIARREAIEWHRRGLDDLARGDPRGAAIAFRRATMKQRGERRYVLALADALVRQGHDDAARRALLGLRELRPEDAAVNLALARLARRQGALTEAVRYYHHAIYSPGADPAASRPIRFELARMLLDAGDRARATAELIAASLDLPDEPDIRLRLATLFREAGDAAQALEQYQAVLAVAPGHAAAREGLAIAAFEVGDFRRAADVELPSSAGREARTAVAVARELLARDPLAPRLTATERRRRIQRNVRYLDQRWRTCLAATGAPDAPSPRELIDLRAVVQQHDLGRSLDRLEATFAEVERLSRQIAQLCGESTSIDEALAVIARRHDVSTP